MIFLSLIIHLVLKQQWKYLLSIIIQEAINAINSAFVEANCAEFGVGLVRLMGRNAGFIAMSASNASRDVNICLLPEFKFELHGERGLLEYAY